MLNFKYRLETRNVKLLIAGALLVAMTFALPIGVEGFNRYNGGGDPTTPLPALCMPAPGCETGACTAPCIPGTAPANHPNPGTAICFCVGGRAAQE